MTKHWDLYVCAFVCRKKGSVDGRLPVGNSVGFTISLGSLVDFGP